jgi:hypothetical protein
MINSDALFYEQTFILWQEQFICVMNKRTTNWTNSGVSFALVMF